MVKLTITETVNVTIHPIMMQGYITIPIPKNLGLAIKSAENIDDYYFSHFFQKPATRYQLSLIDVNLQNNILDSSNWHLESFDIEGNRNIIVPLGKKIKIKFENPKFILKGSPLGNNTPTDFKLYRINMAHAWLEYFFTKEKNNNKTFKYIDLDPNIQERKRFTSELKALERHYKLDKV